jgi:hypothetical protein
MGRVCKQRKKRVGDTKNNVLVSRLKHREHFNPSFRIVLDVAVLIGAIQIIRDTFFGPFLILPPPSPRVTF